jgi:hypothetical protein
MSRAFIGLGMAIGLVASLSAPAHASPPCFKEKKVFALADDFVSWTLSAAPGFECLQGLRWSYMQIYNVLVLKAPKKGKLEIVGSGFRYAADSESLEPDNFTLVVLGKNRHNVGTSVLDIAVEHPQKTAASEVRHESSPSPLAAVPSPQLAGQGMRSY